MATGEENGGVVFWIDIGKTRRVADGVAVAFAVPIARIDSVIEVEAVDRRFTTGDRGELDRDAGGIEDGEGMGDFAEVEACGFASFAFDAMAGEDEENRFEILSCACHDLLLKSG